MPLLSFSALTIVKGAIALSKSAAVKVFVAKNGAAIVGKLGIDGAIAAGATAAGVTGVAVGIAALPEATKKGFSQIIKGIREHKASDFFDGVYKISTTYASASGFADDFSEYVESLDIPREDKISINVTVKEMTQVLVDKIEGKTYKALQQFENKLSSQRITEKTYQATIEKIYKYHTQDIYDDYSIVLGRAGRIYADISNYNREHHLVPENTYDHYLVYCISGWILNNLTKLNCLIGVSQSNLAHDITDNIFNYLRSIGK